jgi:hypothetical protein
LAFLSVQVVVTNFDIDCSDTLCRDNALQFLINLNWDFVGGVDRLFPAVVAHSEKGQNEKGAQHDCDHQKAKVELIDLDSSDSDVNVGDGYSLGHGVLEFSFEIGYIAQVEKHGRIRHGLHLHHLFLLTSSSAKGWRHFVKPLI